MKGIALNYARKKFGAMSLLKNTKCTVIITTSLIPAATLTLLVIVEGEKR